MIQTKHSANKTPRTILDNEKDFPGQPPMGVEEAIIKGKLYNPLNGKELLQLILRKVENQLTKAEVTGELKQEIVTKIQRELKRHPNFDTEVIGYPKSDISISLDISQCMAGEVLDAYPQSNIWFQFSVALFPQEEGKGFSGGTTFISKIDWPREAINLSEKWNMDDIPPDALRILHDLPVPTAQKIAGSGPDGESTIIDKDQPAPEKQREAVLRQFGNDKKETKSGKSNSK